MLRGSSFLAHAPLACARIAALPLPEASASARVAAAEAALAEVCWHDEGAVAGWIVAEPFHAAIALAALSDRPFSLVGERIAAILPEVAGLSAPTRAATHEHEPSHDERPMPLLDHVLRALAYAMEDAASLAPPFRALLTTVLLFADVAKGGEAPQRAAWKRRLGIDGTLHNQDSASILGEVLSRLLGEAIPFALDPRWAERACSLVAATGLVGMRLRGEVGRDALAPIIESLRRDKDATEMARVFSLVNRCDTAAVRWGLWTEQLAACFAGEEAALFADPDLAAEDRTPLAERLLRLRQGALFDPAELPRAEEALVSLGSEGRALLTSRLRFARIWYAEAALGPLSLPASARLLALLSAEAASTVDLDRAWHLDLLAVVDHLRDPDGAPRAYVARFLETLLRVADPESLSRGQLVTETHARALVSFPAQKGREAAVLATMVESDEARSLLTLLPIYEQKSAAVFHQTLKSLCDLYGLRKDDFDRVANEASYLTTMNAARADKARLARLARPGTIVEVGPGGGVVLDLLADIFPGSRVIGLDASRAVVDALDHRRTREDRRWEIRQGDAFELPRLLGERSVDTVVFCSVLHEIFSYVRWPLGEQGERFQLQSVDAIVRASFRALAPSGRILVRDGVMPPDEPRVLELLDPAWREGLELFARTYEPRPIALEPLGDDRVRLSARDLYEFVTTFTWGPSSFPYEIREQRAVLPRADYVGRLLAVCADADPGFVAREVPVPPELSSYLSPGYTAGIAGHARVLDAAGEREMTLPDITGVWVLEKVAVG